MFVLLSFENKEILGSLENMKISYPGKYCHFEKLLNKFHLSIEDGLAGCLDILIEKQLDEILELKQTNSIDRIIAVTELGLSEEK